VIISMFNQKELNNVRYSHFQNLQRIFCKDYYVHENQLKLTNIEAHTKITLYIKSNNKGCNILILMLH
jgi:hypothetical protein